MTKKPLTEAEKGMIEGLDLNKPQDVVHFMAESSNPTDWNQRADCVKKFHGDYPRFWYPEVILKGTLKRCRDRWDKTRGIQS